MHAVGNLLTELILGQLGPLGLRQPRVVSKLVTRKELPKRSIMGVWPGCLHIFLWPFAPVGSAGALDVELDGVWRCPPCGRQHGEDVPTLSRASHKQQLHG